MKLLNWILPLILVLLILIVSIFFPFSSESILLTTIIGVVTFLFGIFISFSISDRYNRLNRIYELDSVERSKLILMYRVSSIFGEKTQLELQAKIDKYLTRNLDYKIFDYYKTEKEFDEIIDYIKSFELTTNKQQSVYESILGMLSDISNARVECISLIGEKLSKIEWLVFLLFSSIIAVCLILINTGVFVSIFIISILLLSLVLLLGLLYSLDNLSWKEEERTFEPYSKTFEAMNLLRYYPKDVIDNNLVYPPEDKDYRVAIFPNPYPDFSNMKIEIVKAKVKL